MDLYCPKCLEPWDMDELHGGVEDLAGRPLGFKRAFEEFRKRGCNAFGEKCSTEADELRGRAADPPPPAEITDMVRELYRTLGHDVDGAAVEVTDLVQGYWREQAKKEKP